ncbi:hypothetical protein pipiens_013943 [Culex pipiens pipiens]|uniref:Protein kinase domain-containing protein n=1 Tax=Culex pipiens pipiens TaxID=38569 RepID=A0ABD1CWM6_CULPP
MGLKAEPDERRRFMGDYWTDPHRTAFGKSFEKLNACYNVSCGTESVTNNRAKRSDRDFIFGKVIGEGSFSVVYLAKDIHTSKECAIKVCEKQQIVREKKQDYIHGTFTL